MEEGRTEEEHRKRPYNELLKPYSQNSTTQRPKYINKETQRTSDRLRELYRRTAVEFVLVIYDPIKDMVHSETSPGLERVWFENHPEEWIPTIHRYSEMERQMQDIAKVEAPTWNPLDFKDIPGGRRVKTNLTKYMMSLALPGKPKRFFETTKTEDFRSMTCPTTGMKYSTWPAEVEFGLVDEMTIEDLESACTWAVRFVASNDPQLLTNRLALSDILYIPETEHLSVNGRLQIAHRVIQGMVKGVICCHARLNGNSFIARLNGDIFVACLNLNTCLS